MALLDGKVSNRVSMTCSLEESTAIQVDQYAAFLNIPGDDVVNKALEYVFSRDKEFQQYREKNADAKVASSLRIKKPGPAAGKAKAQSRQPLSIAQ